ncbi:hypothetical protein PHLGIDRAFT_112080 [Phlebiopsis gigantea 11061_1 CR5-6]|uniref:Uncharacterized protein n=1 Tax=Phlebiopsis gigantea (strain 11061_1 CR5-6) TaxID=745531 RepID=A0A0C3S0E6_PHLG1|nr:hypothetical protein PHLGIDRAFT_112080 [Phlebiopsis gigantea 11061_1 CR5-6]
MPKLSLFAERARSVLESGTLFTRSAEVLKGAGPQSSRLNYLLDAAGLIAIANFKTIARRTARAGSASWLDIFVLAPGIHFQQEAADINGGEYPATAAMTTGYVFRIENQATVGYLQTISKSGCLTTVEVDSPQNQRPFFGLFQTGAASSMLYLTTIALTIAALTLLVAMNDWWALGVLCALIAARFLNTLVLKRRSAAGWKGAPEPGVMGDLIILLSQDRWVRMKGWVDDIKFVTAGHWLRETSEAESPVVGLGTLLVYASAALAGNASLAGSWLLAALLVVSLVLLGMANARTKTLCMFDRVIRVQGVKPYGRRLEMVHELIAEKGTDDWALRLGLIKSSSAAQPQEVVMM